MDMLDPQQSRYQTSGPADNARPGNAFDPWRYRDETDVASADLTGYKVEAADGSIGKVDEASHDVESAYLVVDTGPWILGKKVLIPAGIINHVDHLDRKVYMDRTKEQIKSAPEFDPDIYTDSIYRDKIGGYYGDSYQTPGGPIPPARPW